MATGRSLPSPGAPPPGRAGLSGTSGGLQPGHVRTQASRTLGPARRGRSERPLAPLSDVAEGAVAGPQAPHGAVGAAAVTLAAVTRGGRRVRVQGVRAASAAGHSHRPVDQLPEGARLLSGGPRWVPVHQVLGGLGDREREMSYSSPEVSV